MINEHPTRMRAERLRRRWTQVDLACQARMSAAEISRIESGRLKPYPNQASRIARILGIATERLQEPADPAAPSVTEAR